MEITKSVSKWGNSAGILLPKEWLGNQVKITFIDRTLEIKKEVLNILEPHLEEIAGIYLVGSYARGEEEQDSDIDIIAISANLKKEIISGKYHISIATLEGIRRTLKSYPELILPRLYEAKTIMNPVLLQELREVKINKHSFKDFVEDTKRVIKINSGIIDLDKNNSEYLKHKRPIYSLILRLRGLFLIKNLLTKSIYSKKAFKNWLLRTLSEEEFEKAFSIYTSLRDGKKESIPIKIKTAEKLSEFIKKELKYLEK